MVQQFFNNGFSELFLSFISSLLNVFHSKIKSLEKGHNRLLDVAQILNSKSLENRLEHEFVPMKVSQKL